MGGFGNCCQNICNPARIAFTYGEGVADLSFEMINPIGVNLGGSGLYFGKTAEVCQFTAPTITCPSTSGTYVAGFWKWLDATFPWKQSQSLSNPCIYINGWLRFQTWLTLVSATIQIAVATDGTYRISIGGLVGHTKSKSSWGTITVVSGPYPCTTTVEEVEEPTVVPYCRGNSACTTGSAGTCCFAGFPISGLWGPKLITPGVAYDSQGLFLPTITSGWVPASTLIEGTASETISEFRQFLGIDEPEYCRVPDSLTSTNTSNNSWTCGSCPVWDSEYGFAPPKTIDLDHRLIVEW